MQLNINGVQREMPDGMTVAALLEALEIRQDGIAVAVNHAVVPQNSHASHTLNSNDAIEVIHAVGGG